MMTITRGLAVGIVLAGAAVGLASPASAEPLSGTYTGTVIATGGDMITPLGQTTTVVFTPCGPDCTHLGFPSEPEADKVLHLQGNTWTATWEGGGDTCTTTVDSNLVMTFDCPPPMSSNAVWQLTKNG